MIEAIYIAATGRSNQRIKLVSHRFGESVFIPWNYDIDNTRCQAEEYLIKRGHKVVANCQVKDGHGILIQAEHHMFKPLK